MRFHGFLVLPFFLFYTCVSIAGSVFTPALSEIQLPAVLNVPIGSDADGAVLWESPPVHSNLYLTNYGDTFDYENESIYSAIYLDKSLSGGIDKVLGDVSLGDLYGTTHPAIFVRWRATWRARNFGAGEDQTILKEVLSNRTGWQIGDSYQQSVWIQLVKGTRRRTTSGSLSVYHNASARFACKSGCADWNVRVVGTTQVRTGMSCYPTSKSIVVPMPRASGLTHVGAVSPASNFKIELTCSGGGANVNLLPYVTLTDVSDNANRSGVLTVTGGAAGVGIQILNDGSVVRYGAESSGYGSLNNLWGAGYIIAPGILTYEMPLAARYVQTAAAVKPGPANGMVTFTLNYQ